MTKPLKKKTVIFNFKKKKNLKISCNYDSECIIYKKKRESNIHIFIPKLSTLVYLYMCIYLHSCYSNGVNIYGYYNFLFYYFNIFSLTSVIRFSLFL